ncbi:hypothetical protein [Vibrio sp. B1Z05]
MNLNNSLVILGLAISVVSCGGDDNSNNNPAPPQHYTITSTTSLGGSITPKTQDAQYGSTYTFNLNAEDGFEISEVTGCEGALKGSQYNTGLITNDCNIAAEFTPIIVTALSHASSGGTISPKEQSVNYGETSSFDLNANDGYQLKHIEGCDGTLNGNTYKTGVLKENCEVIATFAPVIYHITAHSSEGGNVSPSSMSIAYGENAQFDVSTEDKYTLESISGCGGSLKDNKYYITNVSSDCTITAQFNSNNNPTPPQHYTITSTTSLGGSITPKTQDAQHGSTYTFNLNADDGYEISEVTGCKGALAGSQYNTGLITNDCSIAAEFTPIIIKALSHANTGGTISPKEQSVNYGETSSFDLNANDGYQLKHIEGCDGTLNGNTYKTGVLKDNCEVIATFAPVIYHITAHSSEGGNVSPSSMSIAYGENAQFDVSTEDKYTLESISGCGGSLKDNKYYITNVSNDCTINAQFERTVGDQEIIVDVSGASNDRPIIGTLTSDDKSVLITTTSKDGELKFEGLNKQQDYILTVSQAGYKIADADDSVEENDSPRAKTSLSEVNGNVIKINAGTFAQFNAERIDGLEQDHFQYHWSEDINTAGREYSSYINKDLPIEIIVQDYSDVDSHASATLQSLFGIILDDSDVPWSQEHAYRLLEMLKRTGLESFPNQLSGGSAAEHPYASHWVLTDELLTDDIEVTNLTDASTQVKISTQTFKYASPTIVTVDGKRGRFFSNRLYNAAIRFVTDNGQKIDVAAHILKQRYGVIIATTRNFNGLYKTIPVIDDDRNANIWQIFQPKELIAIIAILEEFPQGMKDLSLPNEKGGLRYFLRRANGLPHPLYSAAPAVAWTSANYVEFMESAFTQNFIGDIQRLIIHEKSHFLWDYAFSNDLKYEWLKKSGWYIPGDTDGNCKQWAEDPDNWTPPNVDPETLNVLTEVHDHPKFDGELVFDGQWASCSTTQFVTAYAAKLNPNEDMAESISYFLTNPDLLRSRALPKYEFIRDYIMQGSIYLSVIRPDLTFEVLNLYPDYIYPGKINSVDISVYGAPEQKKSVEVTLGLHTSDNCSNQDNCFDGASGAYMRLLSPIGTYKDQYFKPANGAQLDSKLIARFDLPAEAAKGWWVPAEIVVFDQVGNRRIEKLASSDYGWRLYINNANSDIVAPQYVKDSMTLNLFNSDSTDSPVELKEDEQLLQLQWLLNENKSMDQGYCYATISNQSADFGWGQYSHELHSHYIPEVSSRSDATNICTIDWLVTRFIPLGNYGPRYITMKDKALNIGKTSFTANHPTHEDPITLVVSGSTPDTNSPLINQQVCQSEDEDETCLRVTAAPSNPDNPNGETIVKIYYWAYEEQPLATASGLNITGIRLRNPQGQEFHFWHSKHDSADKTTAPDQEGGYFKCNSQALKDDPNCDATTPIQYVFETILPVGSAPGTWGLTEMTVRDLAGNNRQYQFTENLRFDVE